MNSLETGSSVVTDSNFKGPSWNATTNCTISSGSIAGSVTVESSTCFSEVGDEDVAKSPLILYPSSPDCSTPEITINFAQKHEVRQVYLRSTARIYEMYYTERYDDSMEYLSTVRCGLATRDGGVLQAVGVEAAVLWHQRCSKQDSENERINNGISSTTSEDDWVEVKVIDSSNSSCGSFHSSNECEAEGCRPPQDMYEASAEISDASPCMSLTLKLLSLVNKGCVCIDELYVFADPVDAEDSVNPRSIAGNSSSNSLLTMLMPAIMQISKSSSLPQDIIGTDDSEIKNCAVTRNLDSENILSTDGSANEVEVSLPAKEELMLHDTALPASPDTKYDGPRDENLLNHSESILNQVVTRVSRIEDILLRFEDKMLKPIINIDERLQVVENQLQILIKSSETRGHSYTRICAPEFSCGESESNSFYNTGDGDSKCEINRPFPSSPKPAHVVSTETVNETAVENDLELLTKLSEPLGANPYTRIYAPEFSCGDTESSGTCNSGGVNFINEKNKEFLTSSDSVTFLPSETVNGASEKGIRRTLMDDGLLSAIQGFLNSASVSADYENPIKATMNSTAEKDSDQNSVFHRSKFCIIENPLSSFPEPDEKSIYQPVPDEGFVQYEGNRMESCSNKLNQEIIDGLEETSSCDIDNLPSPRDGCPSRDCFPNEMKRIGDCSTGTTDEHISNKVNTSHLTQVKISTEPLASRHDTECRFNDEPVEDIGYLRCSDSISDYLDIKFVPHNRMNLKSSLKVLLSDSFDENDETPSVHEIGNSDGAISDSTDLISTESWCAGNSLVSVDMNYCSLNDADGGSFVATAECFSKDELSLI